MAVPDNQRKLSAIMFTDIVGYTKMMERSEADTLAFLNFHNTLLHMEITQNGGQVIKTVGDAFLADFSSAVNAVRCAVSIQNHLLEHNQSRGENRQLRIGIHVGDVVIKNNDIFGDGVNIASRLQSIAEPGGICISEDVYHHIKNMTDYKVVYLGPKELKNVSRKVGAYKIVTEAIGKRRSAHPKRNKVLGAFLLLAGLAILAAGWYFPTLSDAETWFSSFLAPLIPSSMSDIFPMAAPSPTAVPAPTPTRPAQLAFTATPLATPTAVPTVTPTALPTATPTATPKPPAKHPVVKKRAMVKTKAKKTFVEKVQKQPEALKNPEANVNVPPAAISEEPPPVPSPIPTPIFGPSPIPTTTELPLPLP